MRGAAPGALVALAALAAALLAPPVAAQREVPFLSGRVVDEAGIVPDDVEAGLEQRLAAYEAETGSQVVVLTVGDLAGDPIEDFSLRVAESWKIGRGGVDDGVIFVVARDDRRMRIEVGYGLEPELTDLESGRILDEIVAPRFRQGDFGGGVAAGVDAILASLEGAELPAPARPSRLRGPGPLFGCFLGLAVLFVVFVLTRGLSRIIDRQGGTRRYHHGGWGDDGGTFLGGFGGGGFGGGGRGFGGGGGGGFSGGGGSFGGGGASGSW